MNCIIHLKNHETEAISRMHLLLFDVLDMVSAVGKVRV